MFARLGQWIARWWLAVIVGWGALAALLVFVAPRWDTITHDGDFAYLPARLSSVRGERLLAEAFPHDRAKSQMVLMVVREEGELAGRDLLPPLDLARRMQTRLGAVSLARARRPAAEATAAGDEDGGAARRAEQLSAAIQAAEHALDDAVRLDDQLAESSHDYPAPRLWQAHHQWAELHAFVGRAEESAAARRRAAELAPAGALESAAADASLADWPLVDVWTWYDEVLGAKLGAQHPQARLIVLQLADEFMAVGNIALLGAVEQELAEVERTAAAAGLDGLTCGVSGSAAVGGDMLRAAAQSIAHTELFTVLLVVLILLTVYRSPLLVAAPLATIAAALLVATSLVALLTQLHHAPGFGWWDLKVFTTTRIFVVVIMFGAGTDFCLFLIARYKEEFDRRRSAAAALSAALAGVGDALVASALTTVVGLAMMAGAEFGKFRNSGPVIGLCLLVTLAAALTLAPAILRGLSPWLFRRGATPADAGDDYSALPPARFEWFWRRVAGAVVARPALILLVALAALAPLAWYGHRQRNHVTYDFLAELNDDLPSKRGAELLKRHFPVGESGPVTILIGRAGAGLDDRENRAARRALAELTHALYLDGVTSVRSLTDPLGDYPPGARISLFGSRAWRTRLLRPHQQVEDIFISHEPGLAGSVTRLEVILAVDPFSLAAADTVATLERRLSELAADRDSFWSDATFAFTGVTAAIRDLRTVTQADNARIQLLVVLAVFAVLLAVLRRPVVCLYLIASVLLSYYVTLGASDLFFSFAYGASYQGFDWKAPLFLFVILVAVGQDYNVYLATRVFEEQRLHGPLPGLRRAVIRTGGIITSCGVIMAGTFLAMTSGAWIHWLPAGWPLIDRWQAGPGALRGVVELGFALALGVLLDTFIVRPILVPAFLALWTGRESETPTTARIADAP